MCPAHIAFSTPKIVNFAWTQTFEDVEEAELKQLIIECRGALLSLEAELAARQNPKEDTELKDCYKSLEEKAQAIKIKEIPSDKDRVSWEKAHTSLEVLRSGHIESSQTRETRKGGAIYEQLLWLISRVADPACALLFICGLARRTVKRLNSVQSAMLVKHMAQYRDSLSSPPLERMAKEFDLYADATTTLIHRVSGKRKREQSDNTASAIAWADPVSVSSNESSSTPNSNLSNDDDRRANSIVLGSDVDCGAVVQPQHQVASFSQPLLRSDDRLEDCNWSPTNGAIFKDAGSRLPICENGAHESDGTDCIADSAINLVTDSEALTIIQRSSTNNLAPCEWFSTEAASISRDRDRASRLQAESGSRDARTLLRLLCFLDGTSIPEFLFIRAKEPQKIWSPSGEIQEVPVMGIGLNSDVLSLVSDNVKIDAAIKELEAAMLITSELGAYRHRTLRMDSATQLLLTSYLADPDEWRLQALILVCHTFPMDSYVEPLYGSLGRLQIPQIQCVMNYHLLLGTRLSSRVRCKVAEVLLAASCFQNISWKSKALEAVKAIAAEEPKDYLRIWFSLRKCTLAGVEIGEEIEGSAIQSVGHGQIDDARSNALYGQLIISCALNKIRMNKLDHARSILDRFSPLNSDSPSTMERLVLNKKEVTIGRLYRYQGNFGPAQKHLTPRSDVDAKLDGVTGRSRISQLACVLCELGEPRKAQSLLCAEINIMGKLDLQDIYSGRCLRLSLAEALLQQGSFEEAEKTYLMLQNVIEACPNPNLTIGIEKLRLWVGLARVSHLQHSWSAALTRWEKARRAAEDCNWRAGFIEMVFHYSISDVKSSLGEWEDSESHRRKADELYRREGRQFWLTGLGTYWLDFVRFSLSHKPATL